MCFKFFYSLQQTWRFRKQLQQYMLNPSLQLDYLYNLTAADLNSRGVKVLALDYDAVLAAHGEPSIRPEIAQWLSIFSQNHNSEPIYILSNKPTIERQIFFKQHFPAIIFIRAKRKKPYPDGLQEIIHDAKVQPNQVLLVDDRLCTGILATAIAGTQALWITQPYVDLRARPLEELWFVFLRWLEKKVVKYIA